MNSSEHQDPSSHRLFVVNYLYFGLFFLIAATVQIYHIELIADTSFFVRSFFYVYAVLESAIEATVLAWLCAWIEQRFASWVRICFIICSFALLLSHVVDFFLERLMDMSVWYALEFVSQESYANFVEMLYASNIDIFTWLKGGLIAGGLIAFGLIGYHQTRKVCVKVGNVGSSRLFATLIVSASLGLFIWDSLFSPFTYLDSFSKYAKALPWKRTLQVPASEILVTGSPLRDPWTSKEGFKDLDSRPFSLERKPDIYLFVVESLREDFLTYEVTPTIAQFRQENIHFPLAFSNANATQISWFSLFYSMYPFYWTQFNPKHWKEGSSSLSLLKKMGYEINIYASSRLSYYKMDQMLLGEHCHLADRLYECRTSASQAPSESDGIAMQKLLDDALSAEKKGGRLFVVFLDATHFDYSWPQDQAPLFEPYEEKINYLQAACNRRNLDLIKNRYKNALRYVDTLFGRFEDALKTAGHWEDAVVLFTADHGEEFNEHGHLFHASSLSHPQIHIPLYLKLEKQQMEKTFRLSSMACHMDVFPTIFHYLIGENCLDSVLQGESLFAEKRHDFVVGARYNASRTPFEFYIHNGESKLLLQFSNRYDVFHSRSLQVIGMRNHQEENVPYNFSTIRQHFGDALDTLFAP